jgi:hypothetical protein
VPSLPSAAAGALLGLLTDHDFYFSRLHTRLQMPWLTSSCDLSSLPLPFQEEEEEEEEEEWGSTMTCCPLCWESSIESAKKTPPLRLPGSCDSCVVALRDHNHSTAANVGAVNPARATQDMYLCLLVSLLRQSFSP